ncbi:MAG TPA: hypothetical protein VFC28_12175, partial [Opitutaceae bacterium]|nr:hypothetical protein [Opitutaceae bacterium]
MLTVVVVLWQNQLPYPACITGRRTTVDPRLPQPRTAVKRVLGGGIFVAALLAGLAARAADPPAGITAAPLAPHAHARGKTMFVQLPPDVTGVRT